jgi:hypothetical protein
MATAMPEFSRQELRDRTSADLLRGALDEARHLAQLELSIARAEARSDVHRAERGGVAMGMAAGMALSGFTMLMVTIAADFSKMWIAALVIAGILFVVSGSLALAGWRGIPRKRALS